MTVSDNESDYAASTLPGITDQLSSSLSEGYFLSDDPYASPNPLGVGGQTLYTPSVAIGRLVETPAQIDSAQARFQSSNGQLNATTALSTGYDFLTQGANTIAASLSGPLGTANVQSLINNTWTKSQLLNAIDGGSPTNTSAAPNIDSINADFDFSRALSAEGDESGTEFERDPEYQRRTHRRSQRRDSGTAPVLPGLPLGARNPDERDLQHRPGGLDSWASTFATRARSGSATRATGTRTTSTSRTRPSS